MPCTDGGPSCGFQDHFTLEEHQNALEKLQKKLDHVTEMLCRVMEIASKVAIAGKSKVTWADKLLEQHPGLPKWWSDHQQKDAKEKAIKEAERAVQKAMADLKKLREE